MSKYLEASIVQVELDEGLGIKVVHFWGDSYYSEDGTDTPYRFMEYSWGYLSLEDVVEDGMPNGNWYCELKQYIENCCEKRLDEIYEHYNQGYMPTIIDNLTLDTPIGCYIVLAKNTTLSR